MRLPPWPVALLAAAGLLATAIAYLIWPRPRPRPAAAERPFPHGIVIHHTATGPTSRGRPVNAALVSEWHRERGFCCTTADGQVYHIGYHFLILPNGAIERGRPESMEGAHARQRNDTLGICLVGNFHRPANPRELQGPLSPSARQMGALRSLLGGLMRRYRLSPAEVYLHREVVPTTSCPGDCFPESEVRAAAWEAYWTAPAPAPR